jgi:hypothetical protein
MTKGVFPEHTLRVNKKTSTTWLKFIWFLTFRQMAPRRIQAYTAWIHDLARFHQKDPIGVRLLHLLQKCKLSASSFHLADVRLETSGGQVEGIASGGVGVEAMLPELPEAMAAVDAAQGEDVFGARLGPSHA